MSRGIRTLWLKELFFLIYTEICPTGKTLHPIFPNVIRRTSQWAVITRTPGQVPYTRRDSAGFYGALLKTRQLSSRIPIAGRTKSPSPVLPSRCTSFTWGDSGMPGGHKLPGPCHRSHPCVINNRSGHFQGMLTDFKSSFFSIHLHLVVYDLSAK